MRFPRGELRDWLVSAVFVVAAAYFVSWPLYLPGHFLLSCAGWAWLGTRTPGQIARRGPVLLFVAFVCGYLRALGG